MSATVLGQQRKSSHWKGKMKYNLKNWQFRLKIPCNPQHLNWRTQYWYIFAFLQVATLVAATHTLAWKVQNVEAYPPNTTLIASLATELIKGLSKANIWWQRNFFQYKKNTRANKDKAVTYCSNRMSPVSLSWNNLSLWKKCQNKETINQFTKKHCCQIWVKIYCLFWFQVFAFSNGEDNWTLTLWCLTSGMNDLGSTRLLDLGKPLAGNGH